MKIFSFRRVLFIAGLTLLSAGKALAQNLTLEEQVRNLNANMLDVQRRLNHVEHNGGGGHGEPKDIVSKVDVQCIERKFAANGYVQTKVATAANWADGCRGAPSNQEGCIVTQRTSESACFDEIRRVTGYVQMSSDEADKAEEACKTIEMSCSL